MTITSSLDTSNYGQTVNFTATVTGSSPAGYVEFYLNGSDTPFDTEPLTDGVATSASLTDLPVWGRSITAYYEGDGHNSPATVNFTELVLDNSPTAVAQTYATTAMSDATDNVITDNTGAGVATNPDGTTLTISEVNGDATLVGDPVVLDSGATLTLNSDGSFTYDPTTSPTLESLPFGQTTTISFD